MITYASRIVNAGFDGVKSQAKRVAAANCGLSEQSCSDPGTRRLGSAEVARPEPTPGGG